MTDLEERIRRALHDPRRDLPGRDLPGRELSAWQDPMRRIRREARRQRAAQTAGIGALIAVIATAIIVPVAALRPAARTPAEHSGSTAIAPRPVPSLGLSVSKSLGGAGSPLPPWTKQLGGEVAYECGTAICLMRPDGTGQQTLSGIYPLWDAAWSPNGRLLAFRGYYGPGDGQYDLYELSVNGCRLTRLTNGINGFSPSWSPAGSQVAFALPGGGGIDAVGAGGTGLRRLTVPTAAYQDGAPAWSATNRLAFVRSYSALNTSEIYTMNAAGRDVTALTHGGPGFNGPSWSPDGKLIAFVANPYSTGVIEVASANGTGARVVSPRSWSSSSPTWTPGGKIVFLAKVGGRTSAYIVNPDGTGRRLLYRGLYNASDEITWGSRAALLTGC
jgi:Tol biopolymer transport system component